MIASGLDATLPGPRLILGPLSDDGLDDLHAYSIDPRFFEYLEFEPHRTLDDTRAYLEKLRARSAAGTGHYWYIRERDSGRVAGTFGVHGIDRRRGAAEIGYGIGPAFWGRGYFQEALGLVLAQLFDAQAFHRVAATTIRDNVASVRALERAGFTQEGTLRDYYLKSDGRRFDAVVLGLLAPEYRRARSVTVSGGDPTHGR